MANYQQAFITYLSEFVTSRRHHLIKQILEERTRYITLALEDIYQSQNASAVLRSCDCFGIQDVHIIENRNTYTINPDVALGSTKWLTLHKYQQEANNTHEAIKMLRRNGYRIVATSPHHYQQPLEKFDLTGGKLALFFGTELHGLSKTVLDQADEYLYIPLHGFTESLNISVSAAVIVHYLVYELRNSEIDWHLSTHEKAELELEWLRKTVKHPDVFTRDFEEKYYGNTNE